MTLNAKIGGLMDFLADFALQHKSISFMSWRHATRHAGQCIHIHMYMAVNKMSNLIDSSICKPFYSVVYYSIKTYSLITGI